MARTRGPQQQPQRALILQGGGALGAYEAGVFKALYKKLEEEDKQNGQEKTRPLFDVVAGASIGAANACVLVSYVLNNKKKKPGASIAECWKDSDKALEEFWVGLAKHSPLDLPANQALWNMMWGTGKMTRDAWNSSWKRLFSAYPDLVSFRRE